MSSHIRPDEAVAPPRRARKLKGQGGERREEILDHAQRLFAANGVHNVTTRQIAEAVGVSQPTLYAYFSSKADMLGEVSARAFREVGLASSTTPEGVDPLEAMIRAYIDFGLRRPDAYRIAFMIEGAHGTETKSGSDAEATHAANRAFNGLRDAVADRLGHASPDVEVAAQSLWSSMHGLVALLLARSGFPWVARSRLIDWHVQQLSRSLGGGSS